MPHLDYDLHFWSLYYVMDIYKLEAVQRTISKIIQENRKKELNMQGNLNLHFLEKKIPRVREDDISMFKGVKVYNKRDMYKVLIVEEKVRTPRTCFKLDKFRFRKEIGKTWFTNKVVEEWNKLSHYLIGSGIVDALKKMIERLWKKLFVMPLNLVNIVQTLLRKLINFSTSSEKLLRTNIKILSSHYSMNFYALI